MNSDIIKLYKQLENMEQTKGVVQLSNQLRETLHQNLRSHFQEFINIGHTIGFNELQEELKKAMELLEIQK